MMKFFVSILCDTAEFLLQYKSAEEVDPLPIYV